MEITIPTSWDDVKISQLREISSLDTSNKTKYALDVASILADVDSEVIKKMPTHNLTEIVKALAFVSDLPKVGYKQTITINGQLYAVNDFKYFTLGQWIDIEELGKDWKHNLHKILAVIYLPATEVKGKLNIEPYDGKLDERAELFDQQVVSDVYSASVFFSTFAEQLTLDISLRVLKEAEEMLKEEKNLQKKSRLSKIGRGIRYYTDYLLNRFSIWRRWRRKTQ
jgi:hypothetical protein